MEKIGFVFLFIISLSSYALEIKLMKPCSKEIVVKRNLDHSLEGLSIGEITIDFLSQNDIPFKGNERGINSILETSIGLDSMEILSDTELLAYGWCYSINGSSPENFPDQVKARKGDLITWWYGFAHYRAGKWIRQCVPSHLRRTEVCSKYKL